MKQKSGSEFDGLERSPKGPLIAQAEEPSHAKASSTWLFHHFLSPFFIQSSPSLDRSVPPCVAKPSAVRPVFARVVGELRAANPSKCPRAHESKMLAQGHNMRLRDEGGGRGMSSTQDPQNQDNQHMLDQPRGSLPENYAIFWASRG